MLNKTFKGRRNDKSKRGRAGVYGVIELAPKRSFCPVVETGTQPGQYEKCCICRSVMCVFLCRQHNERK